MPNVVDSSVPFIYDSPVRSGYFQGYISNFRVTTGQALYTGNFTPPTASLTTSSVGAIGQTFEAQRTNLFTYSADFNDASWLKTRSGVTPNTVIAPDGTLTGDYFYANGTGVPYLYKQITLTQYQPYTMSCFVKQGDLPTPRVRLRDFTEAGSVVFDIVSGTISTGASGICSNPSIVDAGNGWFRISAVFTPTIATGNHNISPVHIDDVAGAIFGFYCWGAQLEAGIKPTSYIATTITPVAVGPVNAPATNLLSYSEEFNFINNIPWEKYQVTVRSNVAIAPNGTLTADKLVENTANLEHILFMRRSGRNETATLSVYAKSSERYIRVGFSNFVNYASGATFNLFNGTVVAGTIDPNGSNPDYANPIPSIVSVGDGWYRCSFTVTKGSLQNTSYPYFDTVNPSTSNPVYAGDGSSGVFIWGAQLEIGSIATNYIPTFGAPATRSAGGVAAQINASSVAVLAFVDNSNVTTNLGSIPGVQFVSNTVTNPMIDSIRTGLDYNQPIVEPWQTSQIKVEYLDKIAVGDTIRITNITTGANVTTNVTAVNKDTITFTTIPGFTFTYANNYTVQNLSTTVWPAAQVTTTDWRNASTPRERLATQSVLGNKTLLKYPIITVGGVNVVGSSGNLSLYDRGDLQGDSKFRVRSIISNTTFIGNTINLYLDDLDILTPVASNLTANTSVLLLENMGSATSLYRDGNLRVTDNTTGVKTNVQIISSYFNSITIDAYFDSTSNLSIESRNVFAWPKLTQQPTTKPSSPREYLWFVENFPSYLRSRLDYPILFDPGRRESVVQRFKLLDKRSLHEPKIDLTTPTSLSFYSDFTANYQPVITITGISTVKYNVTDLYINDEDIIRKTINDSSTKILYIPPRGSAPYLANSQVKIRDEVSGNVALYTVQEATPNYIIINTANTFASNILTLSRPVRETTSAFFANGVPRITPQFGVTSVTPLVNLYYATYFPTIRNRTYTYPRPAEVDVTQKLFLKTSLLNKDLDLYGRRGDFIYKVPGTYQWTAPSGITSVSVLAIGGGGGGSNYGDGGGGGGLGWGNVSVVPGQVYTIRVGAGGAGGGRSTKESKGFTGGDSWFGSNTTVAGFGGAGGGLTLDNLGGGFVGEGGGWGGAGGKWTGLGYRAGAGGGGAGGFTGNGGRGGYSHTISSIPTILATTSTGGGGGGGAGAYNSPYLLNYSGSAGGGGGGVGIYGNVGINQELTLFSESLNPLSTIQYWSPQTTFYMDQFGGLGAGTAHGYSPSTSFYLTVPNLGEHDRIRYQFYWHFVDSPDNETNYLEIDGVRYLQFTKVYNAAGASSITVNRCLTFNWVGNNTYSYSPWGGNGWANGYFIVDTGWISHTKSSVQINHFFGLDQAQSDEASYVSHATFQISTGSTTVIAGNIEPMTETVRYEPMNYFTTGTVTVTATDQNTEYSMFKSSGSVAWDSSVYSTTPFNAPCTIEFVKRADVGDNGVSYAMIGWNSDPLTNSSYDTLDYAAYPYRTDTYSVHHNGTQVLFSGSWEQSSKFYIVYDTDGYIRHYNGSKLLYSVFYGTGAGSYGARTVYFDSSFYSVNSTFGGFRNVRVIRRAWNGTDYGAPSRVAARTIYDSPGYYLWTVPQGISKINVYLWGGGGAGGRPGGWSFGSPGGAGGAANATLDVVPGTTYYITVGSGGNYNSGDPLGVGGGGSASFNGTDNQYGGGGGGYSGIFLTGTRTQGNALIIAGGGGGGGSSRAGTGNQGGAGGGSAGQDGGSPYDNKPLYRGRGGTQTAAGVDASSDSANTAGNQGALQGGNSRTNSYGGGGGGGYWGGSGGGYSETNTMAGGGGGSGYLNGSIISIGNLVSGVLNVPGDEPNPLRSTAGNAGAPSNLGSAGRVVIDLVITGGLPGWGGQYGTSGVNFKSDSMPVDGVAGGLYGGGGSGGSDPTSGLVNDAGYQVAGGAGADGAVRIVYGTNVYYPFNSNVNFTTGNTLIAQSNHQIISNRLSASSRDLLLLSVLAPGYRGRSITPFGKQLSDDRVIYRTISKGVGNFTSQIKLAAPILRESVNILKTRGFIKTIIGIKGIRDLLRLGNLRTPRLPYNEAATSLYLTESGRIELFALNRDSAKLFDIAERKKEPLSFWS